MSTEYIWSPLRHVLDWAEEGQHWFLNVTAPDGAPPCPGMTSARDWFGSTEEREGLRHALAGEPLGDDWYILTLAEGGTWTGTAVLAEGRPVIRRAGCGDVVWSRERNELNPPDVIFWDCRNMTPGIAGCNIQKWYGHMNQTDSTPFLGYGSSFC